MKRIDIAIIGCGAASQDFQIPAVLRTPEVNLVAFVDINESLAKKVATKYGVESFYTNYQDIYDVVDAAVVTLPNYLHAPITIDLLNNGTHVLCEKPMATNTSECLKMIEAEKQSDALMMIGHQLRFGMNWTFLEQLLLKKKFGELKRISCEIGGKPLIIQKSVTHFYEDKVKAGGGIIMDRGVHFFDIMNWLFPAIHSLKCSMDVQSSEQVEKEAIITMNLKGNISVDLKLSSLEKLKNTCFIEGTDGWCELGFFKLKPFKFFSKNAKACSQGNIMDVKLHRQNPHEDKIKAFAECIINDTDPPISGQDGLRAIQIAEQCYKQI